MVQVLEKTDIKKIKIVDSEDIGEIKSALDSILYVPNIQIRQRIIEELCGYLQSKLNDNEYKIKVFIGYNDSEICGFVSCQIDPYYSSYSRKCGTFGWLHANSFDVCREMIQACEQYIKQNRVRKLRGNINYPKNLGGIGIQFMGHDEQMLYGVSYSDPNSKILDYLTSLGITKNQNIHVSMSLRDPGTKEKKLIKILNLSMYP